MTVSQAVSASSDEAEMIWKALLSRTGSLSTSNVGDDSGRISLNHKHYCADCPLTVWDGVDVVLESTSK